MREARRSDHNDSDRHVHILSLRSCRPDGRRPGGPYTCRTPGGKHRRARAGSRRAPASTGCRSGSPRRRRGRRSSPRTRSAIAGSSTPFGWPSDRVHARSRNGASGRSTRGAPGRVPGPVALGQVVEAPAVQRRVEHTGGERQPRGVRGRDRRRPPLSGHPEPGQRQVDPGRLDAETLEHRQLGARPAPHVEHAARVREPPRRDARPSARGSAATGATSGSSRRGSRPRACDAPPCAAGVPRRPRDRNTAMRGTSPSPSRALHIARPSWEHTSRQRRSRCDVGSGSWRSS